MMMIVWYKDGRYEVTYPDSRITFDVIAGVPVMTYCGAESHEMICPSLCEIRAIEPYRSTRDD